MTFNKEEFENDLQNEVVKIQDKLTNKYKIKFTIDVTWKISEHQVTYPYSGKISTE